jgi:uncharacterized protein (TIGR03435 family)
MKAAARAAHRCPKAGIYDVDLAWTPDDAPSPAPAGAGSAPPPDIFRAVQRQLGFKLEPSKVPLDSIMVDRAEKPTAEN